MRTAVLQQLNDCIELEEVQIGEPKQGEVLVRTAASAICGSDMHVVSRLIPSLL